MTKRIARPRARDAAPLEAAGRLLLADADHAVLLLDPRGRVAAANAAAQRLLGVRGSLRGRPAAALVRAVVPGDDPVAETYRAATTERELLLAAPGGGEVPVLLRGYRLHYYRTGRVYALKTELDAHDIPTNSRILPQTPVPASS